MRSPVQLFAALAILLATATVTAQVFKWIDKDGKVNFSDTPPPSEAAKGEAKKIAVPAASPTTGAPPAKSATAAERAKESEKRKTDAVEKAKKEQETEKIAKQNEERCREAKRMLSSLDSGAPLIRNNDAGERTIMSDDERSAETARAKSAIAESCRT
jgi:hypothetical protein